MKAKWSVIVAGIALLSLPVGAQEKNSGPDENDRERAAGADLASRADFGAASRNVFSVPEAPRVTPFPSASSGSSQAPGRLLPRFEVAGGCTYVNFHPGSPFDGFSTHGASRSSTSNASRYFGFTAEGGGYSFSRDANTHG